MMIVSWSRMRTSLYSAFFSLWHADVTPLFYLSWLTCTLGFAAFTALPKPTRALPSSLAHTLWHSGAQHTGRLVLGLWAPRASRAWLLWWLLAASGQILILSYFQLQLLAISPHVPFGLLEALVECGLVLGALAAWPLATWAARRPTSLLCGTSMLRVAAIAGAVVGARSGLVALPFGLNVLAALIFGLQDACGRSLLADATAQPEKMALLLSANTLLANGVAAACSAAAGAGWSANAYFWAAAAMQSVVALASPCFRLAPSEGHEGAGEGAASAAGDVHCVVPHERMGPDES